VLALVQIMVGTRNDGFDGSAVFPPSLAPALGMHLHRQLHHCHRLPSATAVPSGLLGRSCSCLEFCGVVGILLFPLGAARQPYARSRVRRI
jgi:hypothetical protein